MNEEIRDAAVEQLRRIITREITEGVVSTESSIAQSLSVPTNIETELTPESIELMQQLQAAMEEVTANGEIELEPVPVACLLYTSPSPRDRQKSRMPSSA